MSEIKVEEYARTELGDIYSIIGKYERGQFGEICVQLGDFYTKKPHGEEWERHLKIGQLIDLIEVGDVVKVLDIDWVRIIGIDDKDILESFIEDVKEENWKILSIVTHEQFQSMEYRLGG